MTAPLTSKERTKRTTPPRVAAFCRWWDPWWEGVGRTGKDWGSTVLPNIESLWFDAGGVHPKAALFFGQSPMETAAVTSMDHGGGPFDQDGNEGPNKTSEKTS